MSSPAFRPHSLVEAEIEKLELKFIPFTSGGILATHLKVPVGFEGWHSGQVEIILPTEAFSLP